MKMNVSKIIFLLLSGFYITLFLSCGDVNDKGDSMLMKKEKNYHVITKYLRSKYHTKLVIDSSACVTKEYQTEILSNKVVVLDSVVKSIKKVDDEYLLNAEIITDKSQKVYASLKCSEEIKEQFEKLKNTTFLIAADISRIDNKLTEYLSVNETIDSTVVLQREQIILYGVCLEIVKKSSIYDFTPRKDEG